MDSQQAQELLKQQATTLRQWVCDHCGEDTHLVPLALLHVNKRLSEQDWHLIRRYNGTQPFEEFVRKLVEQLLETFSHGVWFGECSKIIHYWIHRYEVNNDIRRQDAEDYIKNKLLTDNFARLKSYKENKAVSFNTYISKVIRNLLIDYLRKKKPEFETLEPINNESAFTHKAIANSTMESQRQQNLEEIGRWFFAEPESKERSEMETRSLDIPDAIRLSHKERLFLRAIYKDGMTIAEAGCLPGINMGNWQAHAYHRRLRIRIKKLLITMGYQNLRSLL